MRTRATLWVAAISILAGCGSSPDGDEPNGQSAQAVKPPVNAPCTILVKGVGVKSLEDDYLPSVVTCENGGADIEALKAQAIAARSVAYYSIAKHGGICDTSSCQVYGCSAVPKEKAYRAVNETAGMFLSYSDVLTYGFYLNGDKASSDPPSCMGAPDGYNEKYITYNWGLSGTDVEQTPLGSIQKPGESVYGQNRGCMSQWGARCLEAYKGFDYEQILKFYYGMDIQILTANLSCDETDAGVDATSDPTEEVDGGSDANGGIEVWPTIDAGGVAGGPGEHAASSADDAGGCQSTSGSTRSAAWFVSLIALGVVGLRRHFRD